MSAPGRRQYEVRARQSKGIIAGYLVVEEPEQWFRSPRHCPANEPDTFSPDTAITPFVLHDPAGSVLTLEQVAAMKAEANRLGVSRAREIPPPGELVPEQRHIPASCPLAELGIGFEPHKIELYQGGPKLNVKIDNSPNVVRRVDVVLNTPGADSVPHVEAHDPIVWQSNASDARAWCDSVPSRCELVRRAKRDRSACQGRPSRASVGAVVA
jgi:hypothetical protein